jgi:hypothetical protein
VKIEIPNRLGYEAPARSQTCGAVLTREGHGANKSAEVSRDQVRSVHRCCRVVQHVVCDGRRDSCKADLMMTHTQTLHLLYSLVLRLRFITVYSSMFLERRMA